MRLFIRQYECLVSERLQEPDGERELPLEKYLGQFHRPVDRKEKQLDLIVSVVLDRRQTGVREAY
jgi:hypothetical protein